VQEKDAVLLAATQWLVQNDDSRAPSFDLPSAVSDVTSSDSLSVMSIKIQMQFNMRPVPQTITTSFRSVSDADDVEW
jgi:hypothetical protein